MKKLMIITGLGLMFAFLSVIPAKADGWRGRDRDHDRYRDRDRREWRDGDRFRDRREWRNHDRMERPRYYDRCRPHAYFYWH
jgi:hypothetical protein